MRVVPKQQEHAVSILIRGYYLGYQDYPGPLTLPTHHTTSKPSPSPLLLKLESTRATAGFFVASTASDTWLQTN